MIMWQLILIVVYILLVIFYPLAWKTDLEKHESIENLVLIFILFGWVPLLILTIWMIGPTVREILDFLEIAITNFLEMEI